MKNGVLPFLLIILCLAGLPSCRIDNGPTEEVPIPPPPPQLPCNGDPANCYKPYSEVCFAATHNSYNYEIGSVNFLFPNQQYDLPRQFADGIRAVMIDVHELDGELRMYHNYEMLGTEAFSVGLAQVREFLEHHPRDILTIIFETEVSGDKFEEAMFFAGLTQYIHTQDVNEPWPTLEEMIDAGKRLVCFVENEAIAGTPSWFHYSWDYIHDTDWQEAVRNDSLCADNRGVPSSALWTINHWRTTDILGFDIGVGNPDTAAAINSHEILGNRVLSCVSAHGRIPNFIAVDFYDRGDLFEIVAQINRMFTPIP